MTIRYVLFDWGGTLGKSGRRKYFVNSPYLHQKCRALKPACVALLNYLKTKGIGMAIVSNTKYKCQEMLENLKITGLSKYFDFYIYSSDHNMCSKPCTKIFAKALSKIKKLHPDIQKNQVLYVGNSYMKDVIGASPFMKTAFVTNYDSDQTKFAMAMHQHDFLLQDIQDLARYI